MKGVTPGRTRSRVAAAGISGRRALAPALFLLLLLACSSSCRLPLGGAPRPHETASVAVSFNVAGLRPPAGSRTVVPADHLGISLVIITVTHAGGTATGSVSSIDDTRTFENLVPGTVTVSAVAVSVVGNGVAGDTTAITVATGSSGPLTLAEGATLPVHLDLTWLGPQSGGTGYVSFTMRWPESTGATYVECQLRDPAGNSSNEQSGTGVLEGSEYVWTYAVSGPETGVGSGVYDLLITFRTSKGGAILGSFVESVNVYDGSTSNKWIDSGGNLVDSRSFSAEEMKDSIMGLSRVVVTGPGLSEVIDSPADGSLAALGKRSAAYIRFVPTLGAETGQTISYSWNGGKPVDIDSASPSAQLALLDGAGGNTLAITVTPSSGVKPSYTTKVTIVKGYDLSYDGNGATGGDVPAGGLYYAGERLVLPGNTGELTRSDGAFNGWNTKSDGTGTNYDAGAAFTMGNASATLYARW